MTYTVSIIPLQVIDVVEEDARRLLGPSIDRSDGRHSVDTVMVATKAGYYSLWLAFDEENTPVAALITSIEEYPLRTFLNLLFCSGEDLEEWHGDMLKVLEQYGLDHGCDGMELVGRPGWKAFLKDHGWNATYLVCERSIGAIEKKEVA
jgi:hypothetical protein